MTAHTVLEFFSQTDTGLVRSHNEDAVTICAESGFAILADGMGGYNAGEVASQLSVDIVCQYIKEKQESAWLLRLPWQPSIPAKWINDAIVYANAKVIELANENPDNFGMGTTIVVALCYHDRLIIGHVGDSRAYRFRTNHLELITHDHSVLQSQIDAGLISIADAHFSPIKNLITRAIGSNDHVDVEVRDHLMELNDIYLLCSDGLNDMLDHLDLQQTIMEHSHDLALCCRTLIYLANRQGGFDNISVVMFRVKELHEPSFIEYIFAS